jgi:hypothetical protein
MPVVLCGRWLLLVDHLVSPFSPFSPFSMVNRISQSPKHYTGQYPSQARTSPQHISGDHPNSHSSFRRKCRHGSSLHMYRISAGDIIVDADVASERELE